MSAATTVRNFDDGSITISDDGGNSATLSKLTGTYTISNITPAGREAVEVQTQGAYIGDRLGERVPVEISITAHVARFDEDFYKIAMGTIAGYVSTTADIGDGKRADLQIDEDYSSDTRQITLDDVRVTMSYEQSSGGAASVSIEASGIGAFVMDGETIVSGR